MNKKLHVGCSPLSFNIYCGHVLKDGRTWAANKTDVTVEALVAVAQHAVAFGKPVVIRENGTPKYELVARELSDKASEGQSG